MDYATSSCTVCIAPFVEDVCVFSISGLLIKHQLTMYVWIYIWVFNYISIITSTLFMPTLWYTSFRSFNIHDLFSYPVVHVSLFFFEFPYKTEVCSWNICGKLCCDLDVSCTESVDIFREDGHLGILLLQFHYFRPSMLSYLLQFA